MKRYRYNVGAVKIPAEDRDVARSVLGGEVRRGYRDVLGSDTPDDDDVYPIGSDVAYTLQLTEQEAHEFSQASNARYVELDGYAHPSRYRGRPTGLVEAPTDETLSYMRARYDDLRKWHGRDVRVAVLDQGTTAPVRDAMGFRLIARTNVGGATLQSNGLVNDEHDHGCLVAPNAVPAGGQILDCVISDSTGSAPYSSIAAGINWAVDNGARVINISFGADGTVPQVTIDAASRARDNGVIIVMAAGNESVNRLNSPSLLSRTHWNAHSSLAYDQSTDRLAVFSNYHADASGCGPGVDVESLDIYGDIVYWNGTSASSPHMAQLMARALTGGVYTTRQVSDAFKANTRVIPGVSASLQGAGAYDLHKALAALGGTTLYSSVQSIADVSVLDSRASAGFFSSFTHTVPGTILPDDLELAFAVASTGTIIEPPADWFIVMEQPYWADYERAAGQAVNPTTLYVFARTYAARSGAESVFFVYGSDRRALFRTLTVRTTGGINPESIVPIPMFGTGAIIRTAEVLPFTVNDLYIGAFSQRHPTAGSGSLSLPTGLVSQGYWRADTSPGYHMLLGSRQLTNSGFVPSYASTSNSSTGTWASVALTIPGAAPPLTPVTQAEPTGLPSSFMPVYFSGGFCGRLPADTGGSVPTQTLGIGGITTPPNAILTTGNSSSTLNITQSGTEDAPRVYDGKGFTVPKINIDADYIVVQNFNVSGGNNSGIYSFGVNNTIQNNRITQITSDGDANGLTWFGSGTQILFNEIGTDSTTLLKGARNNAHLDGMQTWNTPSKKASSNILIKGNRIIGPAASDTVSYVSQAIMAQGKKTTDGGGGGTGVSENWIIEGNYIRIYGGNQTIKLDDINNVTIRRNTFAGSTNKIVATGEFSTNITFVTSGADANIITGSYTSNVGD